MHRVSLSLDSFQVKEEEEEEEAYWQQSEVAVQDFLEN